MFIPQLYVINGWCTNYYGDGFHCDDCGNPEGEDHADNCPRNPSRPTPLAPDTATPSEAGEPS